MSSSGDACRSTSRQRSRAMRLPMQLNSVIRSIVACKSGQPATQSLNWPSVPLALPSTLRAPWTARVRSSRVPWNFDGFAWSSGTVESKSPSTFWPIRPTPATCRSALTMFNSLTARPVEPPPYTASWRIS